MFTSGKNGAVRTRVTADSARIRDVLADECALVPVAEDGEDDTRYRLAESVFRHREQLATDPAWRGGRPASPPAGDVDPDALLRMAAASAAVEDGSQVSGHGARGPRARRGTGEM
jgi:hypothetical protein